MFLKQQHSVNKQTHLFITFTRLQEIEHFYMLRFLTKEYWFFFSLLTLTKEHFFANHWAYKPH